MVPPSTLTFRLRGCPANLSKADLCDRLSAFCGDIAPDAIHIQSLARALDPWENLPTKTATLTFAILPSVVKIQTEREWKIDAGLDGSFILDTHFLGLTPLNGVEAHDFRYVPRNFWSRFLTSRSCIAISGLASHPFGSWQPKSHEREWMWIRDALPRALPTARAVLFGYDTALVKSNSFQTITDVASFFIEQIKASSLASATKPLVVLAHSLGGIVFKEAVVALARGGDPDRAIFQSLVGGVLFGVPSRGMETRALLAMVRGQPNEDLVRGLTRGSDYLKSLDEQFSDVVVPRGMNLFWAYETRTSPTVGVRVQPLA